MADADIHHQVTSHSFIQITNEALLAKTNIVIKVSIKLTNEDLMAFTFRTQASSSTPVQHLHMKSLSDSPDEVSTSYNIYYEPNL